MTLCSIQHPWPRGGVPRHTRRVMQGRSMRTNTASAGKSTAPRVAAACRLLKRQAQPAAQALRDVSEQPWCERHWRPLAFPLHPHPSRWLHAGERYVRRPWRVQGRAWCPAEAREEEEAVVPPAPCLAASSACSVRGAALFSWGVRLWVCARGLDLFLPEMNEFTTMGLK